MIKSFIVNATLFIISAIGGILLVEVSIALFSPQKVFQTKAPGAFFVRYDEEIGWTNKEGTEGIFSPSDDIPAAMVRINKSGLREKEVSIEKPSGANRILVLGDSNTFGYGIDEKQRFSNLLSERLPNSQEVVNFGVFGFGTDQEALLFEREGLRYRPDIVILAFSAGDLSDNMSSINSGVSKPFFNIEGNTLVLRNTPVPKSSPLMRVQSRTSGIKHYLYNHSHLYRLLLYKIISLNLYMSDTVREMSEEEGINTTLAIIKGLDNMCRANECQLIVLLISHGEWVKALKTRPGRSPGYYPFLKNLLTGMDISVIDTTDAFVNHDEGDQPLFFEKDPVHLTANGNKLVADMLHHSLLQQGLVTP
jgi:lysophospholipase L1-like esterase